MRTSFVYLLTTILATPLLLACGAQMSQMHKNVVQGEFDQALALARAGETEERSLAVLILEQEASAGDPAEPVRRIAMTGRLGRPSLDRLVDSERKEVQQLVAVYLDRGLPGNDELVDFVTSDFTSVREAAFTMWAGEMDTTTLAKAALDPAAYVRVSAVRELSSRDPNEDQTNLLREALLKDPDFAVRSAAAASGAKLGEDALDLLKQLLESSQLGLKIAAVKGISKLDTDAATAYLKELATERLDEVALAAAAELGRSGDKDALGIVESAVTNERPTRRIQGLLRLDRAKHPDKKNLIVSALDDPSPEVALIAAELARPFADKTLDKKIIAKVKSIFEADGTTAIRARNLLAAYGDKPALDAINAVLTSDDPAAIVAILPQVSLARHLKDQFVTLMAHEEPSVRLAAAYASLATKR